MLLKFFISIVFLIAGAGGVIAQKKALLAMPFHSNLKEGSVQQFLEELNNHTGMIIQYASNIVDGSKDVTLDGSETTVGTLLRKVLSGQHVKLLERNNKLLLVRSPSVINTDELVPRYTIYGFIKEQNSKEPLIGATVIDESSHKGIATNSFGYFSLSLPEGNHRIAVSYIGFDPQTIAVTLNKNTRTDIDLSIKQEDAILQVIVVPATEGIKKNGGISINHRQDDSYNYLMGEDDPLRSAYLLPGVNNIPSSFNGMFVRGGGADENLFLMDGNIVFNPTHILGALSVVNHTSMKSMRLFKSDFPSKYAGATSSVVDVHTKDGNMDQWQGEAEAGTLSGSFTVEGPVVKNKTAVMASFRHSWPPAALAFFQKGVKPDFYDAQFKATQLLNKNNKLMLNFYNGQDEVRQSSDDMENLNKWGNLIGSFVWNRLIGSRSFLNTSVNMSRYKNLGGMKYIFYDEDTDPGDEDDDELSSASVSTLTSIEQYSAKSEGELYLTSKTKLDIGAQLAHVIIKPFETRFSEELDDDDTGFVSFAPLSYDELSAYSEGEFRLGKRFFVRPGLHFSAYQFRDFRFFSIQPRFFTSYRIAARHQVYASYSRMVQYLHLATNPYQDQNTDTWVPSTDKLRPEESDAFNLGYEYHHARGFKASLEGYWKSLYNVTDYADGMSHLTNSEDWEQNVNSGNGWTYGLEAMIRKTEGRLSLLASYALAWSWRQFDNLNNGQKFPYKYDRRHAINTGLAYKITRRFDVSALWNFASGDAFSLPEFVYPDFDNAHQITDPKDILKNYRFVYDNTQHNQYRSSPYQRLDAALSYHSNKDRKAQLTITAGVYNIFRTADKYVYQLKGSAGSISSVVEDGLKTFDRTPYLAISLKF